MNKITNIDIIKECLNFYKKPMDFQVILNYALNNYPEKTTGKTYDQTLKYTLASRCKECKSHYSNPKKNYKDLFFKTDDGRWGLKGWMYEVEVNEENKKYFEGNRTTKTMIVTKVKRDSKLAKDYKENFAQDHNGKIYCEICKKWEDVPKILEVHHKLEISKYEENNKIYTTFDDVILLCPACHKLLHIYGDEREVKNAVDIADIKSLVNIK